MSVYCADWFVVVGATSHVVAHVRRGRETRFSASRLADSAIAGARGLAWMADSLPNADAISL